MSKFSEAILFAEKPAIADYCMHFELSENRSSILKSCMESLFIEKDFLKFDTSDNGTYKTLTIKLINDRKLSIELDSTRHRIRFTEHFLIKEDFKQLEAMYDSSSDDKFKQSVKFIAQSFNSNE